MVPVSLRAASESLALGNKVSSLFVDLAVGVAVVSYDGTVTFGLNADRDAVPDLEAFRSGIEESLAELRRAATVPPAIA